MAGTTSGVSGRPEPAGDPDRVLDHGSVFEVAHSEVARDLARVDWARTPLGPVEAWPTALRNTVRLMLGSRFAMWMGWGPELIFFCNDAYRRDTLGTKYPWALGRRAAEVWSEIWDDIGPRIERVTTAGESTWDEALLLFLKRSGYPEETYHTFSYSPLTDDDGQISGMLCVVSEDTARVIAERRMRTVRDVGTRLAEAITPRDVALAAAEQLSRNPHDVPFALAYLYDESRQQALLNWASGTDGGSPAAPLTVSAGDGSRWADVLFPDDRADTVTIEVSDQVDLPSGGWDRRPDSVVAVPLAQPGDQSPYGRLLLAANPFRPLDEEFLGFLELLSGQLSASLARAHAFEDERRRVAQLAELDRAKTTFFTNVSHELRTPLTLLLGPADDALRDDTAPLPDRQRQRLEVIARNGERLLKLVNTLLDFSRLENGRVQATFEPLDVARYTAELAAMFESAFARAGLKLEVECRAPREQVYLDREMWSKIVLNLLSNALKATFVGGVSVCVDDDPDGAGMRLRVCDTGIGIPHAEQARLFERFHRVSGAALRSHEGSGIGLALVAELAALHGGEVTVESTPNEGSTFTVRIPYGRAHLAPEHVSEQAWDATPQAARFSAAYVAEALRWLTASDAPSPTIESDRARVLVVDDNADMRDYIAGLLETDYLVETAPDGQAALEMVAERLPALVVTDVMMPRLDGFGLLAALRGDVRTMHIPVMMLSARSGDEATVEGLDAGADDYLVKPFSARELLARVRANLEYDRVRRLLRELQRNRDLLAHAEELARVGSWEVHLDTGRVTASDQLLRMLRWTQADLDRGLEHAVSRALPQDRDRVMAALENSREGIPVDLEAWGRDADADPILVRIRAEVIEEPSEEPGASDGPQRSRRVLRGSVQDITEQRAAELALASAAADREAAAREHSVAEALQRSLLPAVDAAVDHLDVAAYYRAGVAGTQVGGDWYDVIDLGAGRTALVLGDVMGRGVQAAAVMGQLRATVRAYARLDLEPADVLELLDAAVREMTSDMIVTCVYAVFDAGTGQLTCASAGHLPVLVAAPGGPVRQLPADGPPLGAGGRYPPRPPLTLPTDTTVTLYTDGLIERRGADLATGIDALERALRHYAVRGALPVDQLPGRLVARVLPEGPDDDVALLIARVRPGGHADRTASWAVDTAPTALAAARQLAVDQVTAWDVPDGLRFDVALIVSELTTNALRHGTPPVTLKLRKSGMRLFIEVQDHGAGSPQRRYAAPTDEHGRGLQLVATLSRRWGTRHTADGKTVWCELAL